MLRIRCNTGAVFKKAAEILYQIREGLCSNDCIWPQGLDSSVASAIFSNGACEVSVMIPGGWELFGYRYTSAEGPAQQDCWDALELVIKGCFLAEEKAQGWLNSPRGEFFKTGVRRRDDPEAIHYQLDGPWTGGYISCLWV